MNDSPQSMKNGYLDSGGDSLNVSLHPASHGSQNSSVIICPPFGEERKCSYRLLWNLSNQLQERGFNVVRFDYAGTGESSGMHSDMQLNDWVCNIDDMYRFVKETYPSGSITAIGVRLGANLALRATVPFDNIILWEPLPLGERYADELFRRQKIKQALGDSASESESIKLKEDSLLDLDGFVVNNAFMNELHDVELVHDLVKCKVVTVSILHITGARQFSGDWNAIDAHSRHHENINIELVREKPFWGKTDLHDSSLIFEHTFNSLTQAHI
jgi:pimeloyl-ACP methyl ester carboxylesterase